MQPYANNNNNYKNNTDVTPVLQKGNYKFTESFGQILDTISLAGCIVNAPALTSIIQSTLPSLIGDLMQYPGQYKGV
jgi:hypothetical protein